MSEFVGAIVINIVLKYFCCGALNIGLHDPHCAYARTASIILQYVVGTSAIVVTYEDTRRVVLHNAATRPNHYIIKISRSILNASNCVAEERIRVTGRSLCDSRNSELKKPCIAFITMNEDEVLDTGICKKLNSGADTTWIQF